MKLLFDQNLSPRLVGSISDAFPESLHVRDVGLSRAPDSDVWGYAKANGLTIVSKDTDFMQMSFLFGEPPKVICIRRGNCSTADVREILHANLRTIREFFEDEELTYLLLH